MSPHTTSYNAFSNFHINFSNAASKCMNTRLRLWRLIMNAALVAMLLFLNYIESTASYFYTQDIWLHSHILKCLLHALSEGKYKNFTHYANTTSQGSFMKNIFHHCNQRPQNPSFPLIAAKYLIFLEFHIRQYLPKVPGTLSKNYEKYSLLSISTITP